MLTADFYPRTKRSGPTLTLTTIIRGQRRFVSDHPVADKRTARRLAIEVGATPWNF